MEFWGKHWENTSVPQCRGMIQQVTAHQIEFHLSHSLSLSIRLSVCLSLFSFFLSIRRRCFVKDDIIKDKKEEEIVSCTEKIVKIIIVRFLSPNYSWSRNSKLQRVRSWMTTIWHRSNTFIKVNPGPFYSCSSILTCRKISPEFFRLAY